MKKTARAQRTRTALFAPKNLFFAGESWLRVWRDTRHPDPPPCPRSSFPARKCVLIACGGGSVRERRDPRAPVRQSVGRRHIPLRGGASWLGAWPVLVPSIPLSLFRALVPGDRADSPSSLRFRPHFRESFLRSRRGSIFPRASEGTMTGRSSVLDSSTVGGGGGSGLVNAKRKRGCFIPPPMPGTATEKCRPFRFCRCVMRPVGEGGLGTLAVGLDLVTVITPHIRGIECIQDPCIKKLMSPGDATAGRVD